MSQITQGSILYGIRSAKYPNNCCYGIIISASCDIANCKVSKLYYLIAVDVKNWFSTEIGYNEAYHEKIGSLSERLKTVASDHLLNDSLLQALSTEELISVTNSLLDKAKDRNEIKKAYEQFRIFCQPNMNDEMRKAAIRTDRNPAKKFLEKVNKGEIIHYYYLPQNAYREKGERSLGLIVDLQEIEILPLDDAEQIQSPGLDYLLLPYMCESKQHRLKKSYWLETEKDFVVEDGNINSPWREHLMQRFSHGFIRIGVDGPTAEDRSQLVLSI